MKKNGIIFLGIIITLSVTSCEKFEDDKFYSTYTAKGRLIKLGDWDLVRVTDINSGEQFTPSWGARISFDKKEYSFVTGPYPFQGSITQIMRPVLESELVNSTDSIEFSNFNDLEYTLNSNKKTIVL
ncbi:MAG: hypothetical protein RLZ10_402, partial [Bacteroidota bacterium]